MRRRPVRLFRGWLIPRDPHSGLVCGSPRDSGEDNSSSLKGPRVSPPVASLNRISLDPLKTFANVEGERVICPVIESTRFSPFRPPLSHTPM